MFSEDYCIEGCYYVRCDTENVTAHKTNENYSEIGLIPIEISILRVEDFSLSESEVDKIPEISIDPEEKLLSFVNSHSSLSKSFVVSISSQCLPLSLEDDVKILKATNITLESTELNCITLICVVTPKTIVDVCYLNNLPCEESQLDLCSDVRLLLKPVEIANSNELLTVGFPLEGGKNKYKCAQSFGGFFTHIFETNFYSVDLLCDEGEKVFCCMEGVVAEVFDKFVSKGCHVLNFYKCNRISVKHENDIVSEYVHILKDSSRVKVGQKVFPGEVLCLSGNSGFSPKPHLHFQLNKGKKSIPFGFIDYRTPLLVDSFY